MRLYAPLIFAAIVLHAHAATIPERVSEVEKKLPEKLDLKEQLQISSPLSEGIKQVNDSPIKQEGLDKEKDEKYIDNKQRSPVKVEDIPVKVVVEEIIVEKKKESNEVTDESDDNIKRVPIDLENPGAPQHQEHETQNALHYDHPKDTVSSIKQSILNTQNAFNEGLQNIITSFQNFFTSNTQLSGIQSSIQNLEQTFSSQFTKLNDTIYGLIANNFTPALPNKPSEESNQIQNEINTVETNLKKIESSFKSGLQSLTEGVQVVGSLRSDALKQSNPDPDFPSSSQPGFPNPIQGFVSFLQNFQSSMVAGFQNVTNAIQQAVQQGQGGDGTQGQNGIFQNIQQGVQGIQNAIFPSSQNKPAGTQSDQNAATVRPSLWQGIQTSISSILRPSQGQQTGQPAQATSQIQPTIKPAEAKPEETNEVPVKGEKPEQVAQPQKGTIQQIIQQNPIVNGIAGAVQKIHHTITNPEKPRDTIEATKSVQADKNEGSEKGHFGGHLGGHFGGGSTNAGDNTVINSGGVAGNSEPLKKETVDEIKDVKKEELKSEKTE